MAQQQTYRVDQAATWASVRYLGCKPRMQRGSDQQDRTADGVPRWVVEVLVSWRAAMGSREILRVGVVSHGDPAEGISEYEPITLVDLEVGLMERTRRVDGVEEIVGVQPWHRASALRRNAETGRGREG